MRFNRLVLAAPLALLCAGGAFAGEGDRNATADEVAKVMAEQAALVPQMAEEIAAGMGPGDGEDEEEVA